LSNLWQRNTGKRGCSGSGSAKLTASEFFHSCLLSICRPRLALFAV
jgi:hypothetical protein